jgi:hypothetical protein
VLHDVFSFQIVSSAASAIVRRIRRSPRAATKFPKVFAARRGMTAVGMAKDKNVRALIKERVAMTAIGPAVIKVKEKRGAILKKAPDNTKELTINGRKAIHTAAVCGAIL